MTRSSRGFSTLAASALLLLLAAFAALAVSQADASLNAETRTKRVLDQRAALWKVVQDSIAAFREGWKPAEEEWVDFARGQALDLPVEFDDLSARVNLNSVNTFLLGESRLITTLKGKSVQAFQDYRLTGPFVRLQAYEEYFEKEALETLYTTWSVFNVNTADELVAEKIAALRTDEVVGASLRNSLQSARQSSIVFDSALWASRSQMLSPSLTGLFGAEPEINVNTADPRILEAVLTYPALKILQPEAKLDALVSGRKGRRWEPESLAALLGVEKSARVLQYLGTNSTFLQGTLKIEGRSYRFVVQRLFTDSSKPEFRLVAQGWEP